MLCHIIVPYIEIHYTCSIAAQMIARSNQTNSLVTSHAGSVVEALTHIAILLHCAVKQQLAPIINCSKV